VQHSTLRGGGDYRFRGTYSSACDYVLFIVGTPLISRQSSVPMWPCACSVLAGVYGHFGHQAFFDDTDITPLAAPQNGTLCV